ncbi:MAG: hypothetical protein JXX14_16595, partial [Deltaproteobacteria bacterium]|nr:hypothetical protein [Deltaproteobacteria bacterium]
MTPHEKHMMLRQYDHLTEAERYALEFVSFCEQPISRADLLAELVELLPALLNTPKMLRKDVDRIYTTLRDSNMLIAAHQGSAVTGTIFERAIRDAILSGRNQIYKRSTRARTETSAWHWYGHSQLKRLHLRFRNAFYQHNEVEMHHASDLYVKAASDTATDVSLPLAQILSNTDDFSFLANGPADFFIARLPEALEQTQRHHQQTVSFLPRLTEFIFSCPHPDDIQNPTLKDSLLDLMLLLTGECWLCGQMDTAPALIERMTGYHQTAGNAVVAFNRRETEKAVSLFESALLVMRKVKRRKRQFFNNVIGQIFIYACLRHDTPQTLLRLKELLEDIGTRTNRSQYQDQFGEFNSLVKARLYPHEPADFRIRKLWGNHIDDL